MKHLKKLSSITLALAIMFTGIVVPQTNVSAAGANTLLYEIFTENPDGTIEGLDTTADAAQTSGIDPTGMLYYNWRYLTFGNGRSYGFPASAGNVHLAKFNLTAEGDLTEEAASQTSLPGREVVFFGIRFFNHSNGAWSAYTKSLSDYKDTGALTVKVSIGDISYLDDAYVYVKSYSNGKSSLSAVKLSDKYYTEADVGKSKSVCIPLNSFTGGGADTYSVNGGFDPDYFAGAGIMLVQPDSTVSSWIAYDDLYICNVEKPTSLKSNNTTNAQTELSWVASPSDIEKYEVYRNDEYLADTTDTAYTDSGLTEKNNYTYVVYAVDKYGARSAASNSVKIYTSTVGAPQSFVAESSFDDELKARLTWALPSYGTPTGYEIYRDDVKIAEVDADTFEHFDRTGLEEETFYTYYVKAKTEDDTSMKSESKEVLVTFIGYPGNVAVDNTGDNIKITWDAVGAANSYKVYRNGTAIATVDKAACEYTDTDWSYSTAYTYHISSVNGQGRESKPSQAVLTVKSKPDSTENIIYADAASDSFYIEKLGDAAYEATEEKSAFGTRSLKISFPSGSADVEGIAFTPTAERDLSGKRANGGRIEFCVYAQDAAMLNNVKVGFVCDTDSLASTTYTARTGMALSDYVKQYGYWSYVSIPIADFSTSGIYAADISNSRVCTFKFDKVKGIYFYTDAADYNTGKTLYIDDIKFADFSQPGISGITLSDGSAVSSGDTISAATKELDITFDYDMNADSFEGNVQLVTADGVSLPVACDYTSQTKTVKVTFSAGLEQSKTYSLKFDGVKSASGVVTSGIAFDFETNEDATDTASEMDDTEYVTFGSQSVTVGNVAAVKLNLESEAAQKTIIDSMDITVSYDSAVLNTAVDKITLPTSIKNAVVSVDSAGGKVTIKIEKLDSAKYVIGSYIANISFTASKAGSSAVTVSGTLNQADPRKSVAVAQSGTPKISVTTASSGSTGGGFGSSGSLGSGGGLSAGIGGGRDEATTVTPEVSYTDASSPQTAELPGFTDLSDVPWAVEAIESLAESGIVTGYGDGTYRPNDDVTREQFAAMIMRAFVTSFDQYAEDTEMDFADVDADEWYYPYVAAAFEMGIVQGSEGRFGVGETITREDMCTMVARAAAVYGVALDPTYNTILFRDRDEISDYAAESVTQLQKAGIVNGIGDNMFAPKDNVTRAMAAKVIYELLKLK